MQKSTNNQTKIVILLFDTKINFNNFIISLLFSIIAKPINSEKSIILY